MDPERQVRELALLAMLAVVRRDKKWLSSSVKEIIYPWIGSLYDPVAAVSAIGKRSFDACFGADRYVDVAKIAFPVVIPRALQSLFADFTDGKDKTPSLEVTFELIHAISTVVFILEHASQPLLDNLAGGNFFSNAHANLQGILQRHNDSQVHSQLYLLILAGLKSKVVPLKGLEGLLPEVLQDLSSSAAFNAVRVLSHVSFDDSVSLRALCDYFDEHLAVDIPKGSIVELKRVIGSITTAEARRKFFETLIKVIRAFKSPDTTRLGLIWGLVTDFAINDHALSVETLAWVLGNPSCARGLLDRILSPLCSVTDPKEHLLGMLRNPALTDIEKLDLLLALPDKATCETVLSATTQWIGDVDAEVLDDFIEKVYRRSSSTISAHLLLTKGITRLVISCGETSILYHIEQLSKLNDPCRYPLAALALDTIRDHLSSLSPEPRLTLSMALLSLESPQYRPLIDRGIALVAIEKSEESYQRILHEYVLQVANFDHASGFPKDKELLKIAKLSVLSDSKSMAILYSLLVTEQVVDESLIEEALNAQLSLRPHKEMRGWLKLFLSRYPSTWHQIARNELSLHPDIMERVRKHSSETVALYSLDDSNLWGPGNHPWPAPLELDTSITILFMAYTAALRSDFENVNFEQFLLLASHAAILVEERRYQEVHEECDHQAAATDLLHSFKGNEQAVTRVKGQLSPNPPASILLLCQKLAIDHERLWKRPIASVSVPPEEGLVFITNVLETFKSPEEVVAKNLFLERSLKIILAKMVKSAEHRETLRSCLSLCWRSFVSLSQTLVLPALSSLVNIFCQLANELLSLFTKTFAGAQDAMLVLKDTRWLPIKVVCRSILIQNLDDSLERARVEMSKFSPAEVSSPQEQELLESQKYNLLLPWRLSELLVVTESTFNRMLALDIFLCLAEGASEASELSSAYSSYFRDFVGGDYLLLLCQLVGWIGSEVALNLSQMEFTILSFDNELFGLEKYAAHLLFRCMKAFPCDVRSWYEALHVREESLRFKKYCTEYMSPLLIYRELQRIRQAAKGDSDKLQLRVEQTSTSCIVVVRYHLEEFSVSFQLSIPTSYPLTAIKVISGERLGISESRWRSWLLSVQTLLAQNLAILEVIRQWRSNAERTLEGIEPCSICYCVLQPSDKTLPSPACKTCRNRFHSACLYKWFKTHGQATCPMCRSPF